MSNSELIAASQLGTALQQAAQHLQMTEGDTPFLRLQKSGEWVYGADDLEVQDGSQWAVNPHSFSEGYVAWGDGELLGEEMSLMTGVPIDKNQLDKIDGAKRGWEKQIGFQLRCLNGEDVGTQVLYKTSSKGGMKAVRKLIAAVVAQINTKPTVIMPVVNLSEDSYKHKTYGKIYFPIFEIKEWKTLTDDTSSAPAPTAAVAEPDVAEPKIEEPVQKRRRPIAS